jgi:hypothetical protein
MKIVPKFVDLYEDEVQLCNLEYFFIGRILAQSRKTPWISVRYVGHVQTLEGLLATSAFTAIMGGDSLQQVLRMTKKNHLEIDEKA